MDKFIIRTKRKNAEDSTQEDGLKKFEFKKKLHAQKEKDNNFEEETVNSDDKLNKHDTEKQRFNEVSTSPNQPSILPINFPVQVFKDRTLKFQIHWGKKYAWLHVKPNKPEAGIFCFYCSRFLKNNPDKLLARKMEDSFTVKGFSNWKKAIEKFQGHEISQSHKLAVHSFKQMAEPIENQLDALCKAEKDKATHCLEKIVSSLKFLAKQGLALRGHDSESGNFMELLKLRSEDDSEFKKWITRDRENFMDGKIQNEILSLISNDIVKQICEDIRSQDPPIFSVICDGTRDLSGEEQISLCFRWIDIDLNPHESFVGLYAAQKTTGEYLSKIILDTMTRLQLPVSQLRGQVYDVAPNMSGKNKGVQALISDVQPLSLFVHCGAHCVNLIIKDACQSCKAIRNCLQWGHELGVLFSQSLTAKSKFCHILEEEASGPIKNIGKIKPLCPTRWIYRGNQVNEILNNYKVILILLEEMSEEEKNSPAAGLLKLFEAGSTYLGFILARDLIMQLEVLNRSLQSRKQTASGLLSAVKLVYDYINNSRSEQSFKSLFEEAQKATEELNLLPIALPRKKYACKRFSGPSKEFIPESAEMHYKLEYFTVIDTALTSLTRRFDQEGLKKLDSMEQLLIGDGDQIVPEHFSKYPEINVNSFIIELKMFRKNFNYSSVEDAVRIFRGMVPEVRNMFKNVETLLRLLLVVPSSSCEAERSFSALRRLKTYLRSSMTQKRLNHLVVCHVHKERIETVSVKDIAHQFISLNERRQKIFSI